MVATVYNLGPKRTIIQDNLASPNSSYLSLESPPSLMRAKVVSHVITSAACGCDLTNLGENVDEEKEKRVVEEDV
jgi:hypothetical protein